ncbi:hypothetical protein [Virgibacillus profundi]|nr:hypothetical protein [Virgibacillus profundi]
MESSLNNVFIIVILLIPMKTDTGDITSKFLDDFSVDLMYIFQD